MPTLKELTAKHGSELGARLDSLRPIQQQEIAEAAYDEGFMAVMEALLVPVASLERCMRAAGFEQCTGECEAWFGALELDDNQHCGDCADSEGFAEHQAKMKARDEWIEAVMGMLEVTKIPPDVRATLVGMYGEEGMTVERAANAIAGFTEPAAPPGN